MPLGQLKMACYQNLLGIFPNFFDFKLNCAIAEVQSGLWVWPLRLVMTIISSVSVNLLPEMSLVACTIPLFSWHEEMSPRPPLNNRYQFCPLSEDERMKEGKKMERFLLASLVGLRGNFLLFGNCINFHGHLRLVGLWMWASEVTWVCVPGFRVK